MKQTITEDFTEAHLGDNYDGDEFELQGLTATFWWLNMRKKLTIG